MRARKSKTGRARAAGLRRNPVARTLREAAYRARKEANRRRYSRKAKHRPTPEAEPS